MKDSKAIYKELEGEIKEINTEIELSADFNDSVASNLKQSSIQIRKVLDQLRLGIEELDNSSEWDNYTISFIGETNAGKSTIIEALRIKYNEEVKQKELEENARILSEIEEINSKLIQEEAKFNLDKKNVNIAKNEELKEFFNKIEKSKKSFIYQVRKWFQKNYEPYSQEISILKEEIEKNYQRKFEDLDFVKADKDRKNDIQNKIKYDGEIIGDGSLDFTQSNTAFYIKVNDELVKVIDVPGIEGNEEKYEEDIKRAVRESHCVFYVTTSAKTLESGTLSKIKKYIKDQADVYAIFNFRFTQYKEEFIDLEFNEIFKNKLVSIESISNQLKEELKGNFIDVITLNGHWGFLSLSKYLNRDKLLSDKNKLTNIFKTDELIFEKSNLKTLDTVLSEAISQKEDKIYRTNVLKLNTLIEKLIVDF